MFDGQTQSEKAQLQAQVAGELAALQAAHDDGDRALAGRLGIGRTDLRCLDLIMRDGPQTAGALARKLRLTPGSVTALLDRLEAKGYASRAPDPTHGKRVLITPTAHIVDLVTPILATRIARGRARLNGYTADELTLIRDFLAETRESHRVFAAELNEEGGGFH
ncbi:MarR family winged helix-turn-helix transcriptional regulator [Nocardia acidivorans]|uniref:MarR family winged helix-turn-helix transcriptional regulator n=1 Tax=Nocardia acidivorans TaxID=404580 RepID=UPI0008346660|nr:MarR family transcriptional regulator [Nocardia acidivorans]